MDFSKIVREVRIMTERLSAARFWALWLLGLLFALGYMAGKFPWEQLL